MSLRPCLSGSRAGAARSPNRGWSSTRRRRSPFLPEVAILTDPSRARALLEEGIRRGSPAYADIRIEGCTPTVTRYKRGDRCTVVYRLAYGPEAAGRRWPEAVVAKLHRGSKARTGYEAMRVLWRSDLRRSAAVTIAEPLAFLPELGVLIQGAVPHDSTLGDLLESALPGGAADHLEEIRGLLAKTARGLAAVHGCGAHAAPRGWQQEMAEIRGRIVRLRSWIPGVRDTLESALARLEAVAASHVPPRPVPSHGSFRPAQVLLCPGGRIAFIDFDGLCEAEPAMDLALFRASFKQRAMRRASSAAQAFDIASELDELCDRFLDEYERAAPVSRERVALWETLYLLENVLNTWEKVRPEYLPGAMALFEHHLQQSRLPLV